MVIYLYKSRRFIECTEINAITVDRGSRGLEYTDIIAVLPDGGTMSLINKKYYSSNHFSGYSFGYPSAQVDEEEKETAKQVWEKVKKALLSGKTPSLKL